MRVTFTDEERELINNATHKVADDLRDLYNASGLDELEQDFETKENGKNYKYTLTITDKGIWFYHCSYKYACIEKRKNNGNTFYPKVKDITFIFEFLRGYEDIRKNLENKIKNEGISKKEGMDRVAAINNKYSKEAVIFVDIPETINQTNIVLSNEDGMNTGLIKIGSTTIKVLATDNVKIVCEEKEKAKTKRK